MADPLVVSSSLTVPANELRMTAVRASGPGGQNVNKVASKVELRFDFQRSRVLSDEQKARLGVFARARLDAEGAILIVSQLTRDRQRNLEDARAKLAELLIAAGKRPKRRKATKPSRGAKESRLSDKRRQSDRKKNRSTRTGHE
jgi:ribosome-associated protein